MTDSTPHVWLDAGGSARPHPVALRAHAQALADGWADPRRLGAEGRRARALLDAARGAVAEVVGARTAEVHFAPSHTAALHSGIAAVAAGRRRVGDAAVLSAVERAALLHGAAHAGLTTHAVAVERSGRVDEHDFTRLVAAPGVALAALQRANGEVGTLQPVREAHDAARRAGVPLVVDAGASAGHVPLGDAWDVLALDPPDWGAVPGVGVLVVRSGVRWRPTWPEDDEAWFPGGVSVPAAFAAAASLQAVVADLPAADAHRRSLVERLRREVPARVDDVEVVGDDADRLPHVVTFSCLYVDGEALVSELDRAGFSVGSGSACTSSALEPSHVLAAMGVLTHGNVRIALGRDITSDDVDRFLTVLPGAVTRVRRAIGAEGL